MGVTRFSMPARLAANLQASQATFGVIGLSARQLWMVPGNNQVLGFIQRQYSRKVSSSLGLSGT